VHLKFGRTIELRKEMSKRRNGPLKRQMNNWATDKTVEATERAIKATDSMFEVTERAIETTEEQLSDGRKCRSDG